MPAYIKFSFSSLKLCDYQIKEKKYEEIHKLTQASCSAIVKMITAELVLKCFSFFLLLAANMKRHEQEEGEKKKDSPRETSETNNKELLVRE